jgi:ribonuclease HI
VATVIVGKEYGNETIQIYTDGSRNEQGVGAGVAMISGNELVTALKYRLDNRGANNQAEQLAMAKALEAFEKTDIEENSPCTAAIITDRKISQDSIKNINNQLSNRRDTGEAIEIGEIQLDSYVCMGHGPCRDSRKRNG